MSNAKWGFITVSALAALGFGSWAWATADLRDASSALDKDYEEARKLGLPLEAKDLAPVPPVPDDVNGAFALGKAETEYQRVDVGNKIQTALADMVLETPFPNDKVRVALKPLNSCLDWATKAATFPECDLHRDFNLGPALLLPDLASCKAIVKTLGVRAQLSAAQGDWKACIRDLDTARQIAVDIGKDPVLISLLVSIADQAIINRAEERCLTLAANDPVFISKLSGFVHEKVLSPDFALALRGEAFMGVTTIRNLDLMGGERAIEGSPSSEENPLPDPKLSEFRKSGLPSSLKQRAYLARNLEFWISFFKKVQAGERDPEKLGLMLDAEVQTIADDSKPSQRVNKILFPVFGQAGAAVVKTKVYNGLTAALFDVVSYKTKVGRWPKNLAEAGVTSTDPFSGQPYRMLVVNDSVRIYSVGPNRVDEKGVSRQDPGKSNSTADDITSYYPATVRPSRMVSGKRPVSGGPPPGGPPGAKL